MDWLAVFASLKLSGDRVVRDVVNGGGQEVLQRMKGLMSTSGVSMSKSSGRRRRRRRDRYSRRAMTDAELEAELELRRARRAREQDRYKRGLERKKLHLLEGELSKLRSELSTVTGNRAPTGAVRFSDSAADGSGKAARGTSGRPGAPPPPPPPPPGLGEANGPKETYAERRARELKNKPKKPKQRKAPTLLDCLREAGDNPQARLKKKGTVLPDANELSPTDAADEAAKAAAPAGETSVPDDTRASTETTGTTDAVPSNPANPIPVEGEPPQPSPESSASTTAALAAAPADAPAAIRPEAPAPAPAPAGAPARPAAEAQAAAPAEANSAQTPTARQEELPATMPTAKPGEERSGDASDEPTTSTGSKRSANKLAAKAGPEMAAVVKELGTQLSSMSKSVESESGTPREETTAQ